MSDMATLQLVFVIAALICFLLATFGISGSPRFSFVPAGLAALTAAYLLGGVGPI
jgi:hypothetical protein